MCSVKVQHGGKVCMRTKTTVACGQLSYLWRTPCIMSFMGVGLAQSFAISYFVQSFCEPNINRLPYGSDGMDVILLPC